MRNILLVTALILILGLVACGGEAAPAGEEGQAAGVGDVAAGEALYNQSVIGSLAGCMTCHSLEPGVTMVGPSLANIGAEAGSRVSGQPADEYLRQAIVEPNAHVVEGFGEGLMPVGYGNELSEQQLNDMVAFLQSLK